MSDTRENHCHKNKFPPTPIWILALHVRAFLTQSLGLPFPAHMSAKSPSNIPQPLRSHMQSFRAKRYLLKFTTSKGR